MTEMMKRYEAETGNEVQSDAFAQHEIWEYIRWLESQLAEQTLEKFQEIIRNQCDEISALKSQLTWRPVSDPPKEDGWYLCKVQYYIDDTIGEEVVHFDGERFVFSNVIKWLPIPPAPEVI